MSRQVYAAIGEAEQQAAQALADYCNQGFGMQALIVKETKIAPASLSRMVRQHDPQPISMEQALLIELATAGALRAEQLCPSRAAVLQRWLLQRATQVQGDQQAA